MNLKPRTKRPPHTTSSLPDLSVEKIRDMSDAALDAHWTRYASEMNSLGRVTAVSLNLADRRHARAAAAEYARISTAADLIWQERQAREDLMYLAVGR